MSAAVTRDLTITYGTITIGSTSDYLIVGEPFGLELGPTSGSFECVVLLSQDTETAFQTAEATLITAFRTPKKRLRIVIGSNERYDFDPADSTGFDHEPSIEKIKDKRSTATSCAYRIKISWGIQATLINTDGRASSSMRATETPSGALQIEFSGLYTAESSNSAYAAYVNGANSWIATRLGALFTGKTFNKILDESTINDTNTACQFSRLYKEVFVRESVSTVDVAYIVDQQLGIAVTDEGIEASEPSAQKPQQLLITYDASILKSTTTDLRNVWETTIFPHLLAQAAQFARGGTVIATDVSPIFSKTENRISANVRCQAFTGGLLAIDIDVEDQIDLGISEAAVWDDIDYSRDIWQGPKSWTRIVTTMKVTRGGTGVATTIGATNDIFGGNSGLFGIGNGKAGQFNFGQQNGLFGIQGAGAQGPHIPNPDHQVQGNFIERSQMRRKKRLFLGVYQKQKVFAEYEQRVFTRAEKAR